MYPEQHVRISITMKNTGTTTWKTGGSYYLKDLTGNNWSDPPDVVLLSDVLPGQSFPIAFTINAPPTPGTYNFQWRMYQKAFFPNGLFGQETSNKPIIVEGTPPEPQSCTTPGPGSNKMVGCAFYDVPINEKLTHTLANASSGPTASNPAPNAFTAINTNFDWFYWNYRDFSIRWQGTFNFTAGDYDFYVEDVDDGVRLYIDNVLVINKWVMQCCPDYSYRKTLSSGNHTIKLEYFNEGGPGQVKLRWLKVGSPPPTTSTGTIQGYKVKMPYNDPNPNPPSGQTVTLDGANPKTVNPYFYLGTPVGTHTVAVTVPAGWSVGYTLCYDAEDCHNNPPTMSSSALVNVMADREANLWWHYFPPTAVGSLLGRVVKDSNGNQILDVGEAYIRDPSSYLPCTNFTTQGGIFINYSGPITGSTVLNKCNTDPSYGVFLPVGTYTVNISYPAGWESTGPNPQTAVITENGFTHKWFQIRPTLTVNLTANPTSGIEKLDTVLQATVGGGETGTINYSMWWNCNTMSTSVQDMNKDIADGGCGVLPTTCSSNIYGYKCDNITTNPLSQPHTYSTVGTFYPKVIVERGAQAKESHKPVTVVADKAPTASSVTATQPNYCTSGPGATITWTFTDPDPGDAQSARRVQVDNNNNFSSPEIDTDVLSGADKTYFAANLSYATTYYVRVMVWDTFGIPDKPSPWSSTISFTTPSHPYPQVNFSWTPSKPNVDDEVKFTNSTVCGGAGCKTNAWTWTCKKVKGKDSCQYKTSSLKNPTNTFYFEQTYPTNLTVTDNEGFSCSRQKTVILGTPIIPGWREIAPF